MWSPPRSERARLADRPGGSVRLTIPSDVGYLRWARAATASSVRAVGIGAITAIDVVLVVDELVSNAIGHGTGDRVQIELTATSEEVTVATSNAIDRSGAIAPVDEWRVPAATAPSGRGLGIVRALSRDVDVAVGGDPRVGADDGNSWVTVACRIPVHDEV